MAEFVVHGVPGSPYVRTALLALEEKGAPWRIAPLSGPGAGRSPEHLARQPFGRMPVVDHGDFQLYETQAILRYLDRLYPEPSLTPSDPRAEARMNQLIGITDWYFMPHVSSGIVFPRVVAPQFGMPVDEERIAAHLPLAVTCLAEVSRLMGEGPYLTGDTVSLADLQLAPQMDFLTQAAEGEELLAPHANLRDWIERMKTRSSMQATTWAALAERVKPAG